MPRSILSLFARSPWGAIQEHMRLVNQCVDLLEPLIEAVLESDEARTAELAAKISDFEHQADETKNTLRDHLPRSVFLPVAREDLLDILHVQDGIADSAEDAGVVASIGALDVRPSMADPLRRLVSAIRETCNQYAHVIEVLDDLVEASFTGSEADRVLEMVNEVARLEHEADVAQAEVSRALFNVDREIGMRASVFHVWVQMIRNLSSVANKAEKAGNRIRMFLAT